MSTARDPFIKLHHLWTKDGQHRSSVIFLRPEKVTEITDGEVHMEGNYSFDVSEKAAQIHDAVIAKIAENAAADRMGTP